MTAPPPVSPPYPFDSRRARALATGRAIVLRRLLRDPANIRVRDWLLGDSTAAAVALGLWPSVAADRSHVESDALGRLTDSIAFRMGADLRMAENADLLWMNKRCFRAEAATAVGAAPPEVQSYASGLIRRAVTSSVPLRERLHDQPPVVVFSTPGAPELTRRVLGAYLASFAEYEHDPVPVLLVDDARAEAEQMAAVVRELRERFPNPIIHLREWTAGGEPGEKARLRDRLIAARPELASLLQRTFAARLAGSANLAFWLLRGRASVWIDQDSSPNTVRLIQPVESSDIESVETIGTLNDLEQGHSNVTIEPVDILFLVDWILDAPPETVADRMGERDNPTREDAGYERLQGVPPSPMPPVRICTFHVCGHRDYRARVLHYRLLAGGLDREAIATCIAGSLPFYDVLRAPIPLASARQSKTAFGTTIAFSAYQPLQPIGMLATGVRLVDLSVGQLLQAAGPLSIAWAPAALGHFRAAHTGSGRGRLAHYLWNEDLMAILLPELSAALTDLPSQGADALAEAGRRLLQRAAAFEVPPGRSGRIHFGLRDAALTLAARTSSEREYAFELAKVYALDLADPLSPNGWRQTHDRLTIACAEELRNYGEQLIQWQAIAALEGPRIDDLFADCY